MDEEVGEGSSEALAPGSVPGNSHLSCSLHTPCGLLPLIGNLKSLFFCDLTGEQRLRGHERLRIA